MKCPDEVYEYMHNYLDEEISAEDEESLRKHLQDCEECRTYFHEMKKAVALVQSTSHIKAPDNFTERVKASLPKEKKNISAKRWMRNHPLLTAASLFIILMAGSLFSTWNQDETFSVSKQNNLVVDNETVIVPAGEVVNGDVVVKNGDIRIEGEVRGNVTVINGKQYMASAGNVTGQIYVIDQMFEWLWFNIKDTGEALFQLDGD
ncbi:anti-sigma factor family protein [Peribacillus huizhouensis]|uniref:Anti-sigma-W factor RsiW n=1 Tax=Peribacillus huizhouensis TaxID=1501239 RepID=A0ABR6CWU0_9BACI|nr:anti-sigma factor [Peribacillus huizhouensis]MBA9029396.1 anti-sigma factor RsiW [Peribacillus huizhouensis]